MPRKEINDYIFYKIVCLDKDLDLCYVGSTSNFNKRKSYHKNNCNNINNKKYHFKVYETIRENGGWDNFKMIQLGTREQIKIREAEAIEEEYRQELKANMNTRRSFRTEEQKYEQNKHHSQLYKLNNKDKLYADKKSKVECECGCLVSRGHLARHKNTKKHLSLFD